MLLLALAVPAEWPDEASLWLYNSREYNLSSLWVRYGNFYAAFGTGRARAKPPPTVQPVRNDR